MIKMLNLFILYIFLVNTSLYAIDKSELDLSEQNSGFSSSFVQLQIFSPFLPHTSLISGQRGFSVSYMYPGFYNGMTGQVDFSYTTSSGDTYHFGIGIPNLNIGINKKIIDGRKNSIYLNIHYGVHDGRGKKFIMLDNTNTLIGLSDRISLLNKSTNIEIAIDCFVHAGQFGDLIPFFPYMRGIVSNIHLSHIFFNKLVMSYGIGFGFVQYRYDKIALEKYINSEKDYEQECYISYNQERLSGKDAFYKERKPGWDDHLIIPFGLSLSYKF